MGKIVRINRAVAAVVLAALGTAVVELSAPGVATAAPVASGSVNCPIAGSGAFGPQLVATASGTGAAVKVRYSGKSAACTSTAGAGGAVVTIHSASFKAKGVLFDPTTLVAAKSCTSFTGADEIKALKVKITWNATPPIANTIVTYSAGSSPWVSNNAGNDRLNQPATATTTITGSFATAANALINLDSNIVNTCSSTWGPYPTFNFGLVASTLNIF
ncbi:MAG TPA: hypothetical protein VNC61_06850 [Acidimicrobiales bacterium]|nr:hypothetical protein [Acidimicrobiales bacterium]